MTAYPRATFWVLVAIFSMVKTNGMNAGDARIFAGIAANVLLLLSVIFYWREDDAK